MEPTQKSNSHVPAREDEVDLGQLIHKTGGLINNFFNWLGRVFTRIGQIFLHFLFFLTRNLVWLLAGLVLGLGYGLYQVNKKGANYFSEMTVRANFNSARSVYGSLDFFNALINNGQQDQLSKIFKISPEEASSLITFESRPVISEIITAELYKEQFLNLYHNTRIRMDTFWIKTIKYEDFKNSLTKYDYPLHQIRLVSTNPGIFPKIQEGLIAQITNNELLQQEKANGDEVNKQEVALLESSLQSLDTLRSTYNKRLLTAPDSKESGNNLTLLSGNLSPRNPELELYDKVLQLKDELRMVRREAIKEKNIIQIYSSFNSIGQKEGFLDQKIVKYSLTGLLAAFIIVAAISLFKLIISLEKKYTQSKKAGKEN